MKKLFWIKNYIKNFRLSRNLLLEVLTDSFLIFAALKISFYFSVVSVSRIFSSNYSIENYLWFYILSFVIIFLIAIPINFNSNKPIYFSSLNIYVFAFRNFLTLLTVFLFGSILNLNQPSIDTYLTFWFLLTIFFSIYRVLVRDFLINFKNLSKKKLSRIAIFGAGDAGSQLCRSIKNSGEYEIVCFFDDNHLLEGKRIYGVKILSSNKIEKMKREFDKVFLAIPSLNLRAKRDVLNKLQDIGVSVFQVPTIEEIITGKNQILDLKPISISDLLGRKSVKPYFNLYGKGVDNQNVCVIGAGGSIGGELCFQIAALNPNKLLLIDNSEPSLYSINSELRKLNKKKIIIKTYLGDAKDENFLQQIFKEENIEVIFHAAAYKHVPLVEENPVIGVYNNVFSTISIAKAAIEADVKKVLLISTDKAVRPSNVMGASKRLSELVFKSFYQNSSKFILKENGNKSRTIFTMVRFGNVLGSSGSVVPLFLKQISEGGPITLTDNNMYRYFMSIQEAAQLVIQSIALASGGEVFILDMGKPVKILFLAEQMIKFSGLTIKNKQNPNGDIEIITIGSRPGEKLSEELLIKGEFVKTDHPLIYREDVDNKIPKDFSGLLNSLEESIKRNNKISTLKYLSKLVPEWDSKL